MPSSLGDDKASEKSDHSDSATLSLHDASDDDMMIRSGITLPTRTYTCSNCSTSTTSSRIHLHHLVDDHGYDYIIYECDLCDYATRYKQKLPRHRKCHFMSPVSSPGIMSPQPDNPLIPLSKKLKLIDSKTDSESIINGEQNKDEKSSGEEEETGEEMTVEEGVDDKGMMMEEDDEDEEEGNLVIDDGKQRDINENVKDDLHITDKPLASEHNEKPKEMTARRSSLTDEKEGRSSRFYDEKEARRSSFSDEKEAPRSSFSNEKEARRSNFSDEKEARRSSFSNEIEGRMSSFSDEKEARRSSFSDEKEGRRSSFSDEKETRRSSFSDEKEARRSSFSDDKDSFNHLRERLSSSLFGIKPKPVTFSHDLKSALDGDSNLVIDTDKMSGSVSFTVDKPIIDILPTTAAAKPKKGTTPFREAVDPAKYIRIQDVDGIKYACSKCGNIYKWRKSLNKHWKEKHDGEIPTPINPSFTMLNVPQIKAAQNSLSSLQFAKGMERNMSSKSYMDRANKGYGSTLGMNSFDITSPIKFDAKTLKMSPYSSDPFTKAKWNRPKTASHGSPAMHNIPSPAASLHRSRPENPINLNSPGSMYQRPGDISLGAGKHQVFDKPSPYSNTPYSMAPPPVAHGKTFKQTEEVCDEAPLDLSKSSTIPKSGGSNALDLTRAMKVETSSKSNHRSDHKSDCRSVEQPLDFSSGAKSGGKLLPGLPGVLVKEEVDDYQEYHVRGSGLPIFSSHDTWQCYKCTYVASSGKDYEQHLQEHDTKQTYRCYECKHSFVAVDDLNAHFINAHMEVLQNKLYEGEHSHMTPEKSHKSMQLYKYLTMPREMNTLNCVICGSKFTWQWDLEKHFEKFHTSLPNPYKKSENHHNGEEEDKEDEESGSEELTCTQCKFVARDPPELTRHHLIHSLNRPYACTKCGYSTKWNDDLQQHMKRYHVSAANSLSSSPEKPTEPDDDSNDSLTHLYEKHTYFSQLGLRSNNNSTPSPPLKSSNKISMLDLTSSGEKCNKTPHISDMILIPGNGRSKGRLSKDGSTSAEILLPYKCSVCEYRARWPSEITQHMKNHSDEKPFHCPRCTYKSKWKWDVVKHLKRCGGGTVKDVIDTTKHRKVSSPPWVKALQFKTSNSSPLSGSSTLSAGPPNVTVVPMSQSPTSTNDSPTHVMAGSGSDDSKLVPYSRSGAPPNGSPGPQSDIDKSTVFRGIINQGQYHCLQCPFVGNSPAELKRHTRVHSDEKPFGCLTCGYCSKWKCDLKKHMRTYNHEPAPQPGEAGFNQYSDSDDDWPEMESDNGDEESHKPTVYRCDKCQYSTFREESLEAHTCMQTHTQPGEKSNKLKCRQCDYEASDLPAFLQHKLFHNSDRASSPASREGSAERDMPRGSSPPRHRRKPQKSSIQHRCPKCPYTCFSKVDMLAHQARHGSELAGSLVCEYCDFHSSDKEEIEQHSKLHPEHYQEFNMREEEEVDRQNDDASAKDSDSEPLASLAKKKESLLSESSLMKTVKSPGTSGYQCDKCPYFTCHRSNYEKHYRMHGADLKYHCEWCDWSIDRLNLLFRHAKCVHPVEFHQKEKEGATDSPADVFSGGSEQEDGDKENTDVDEGKGPKKEEKEECSQKRPSEGPKDQEPLNKKLKIAEKDEEQHFLELSQTNFDGGGKSNMEEQESMDTEDTDPKNLDRPGSLTLAVDLSCANLAVSALKTTAAQDKGSPNERGSGRKMHKCPKCQYQVKCRDALQHHLSLHGAGHQFKCEYCDYSVHRSNLLLQHVRVHSNDYGATTSTTPQTEQTKTVEDNSTPIRSKEEVSLATSTVKKILKIKLSNLIKGPAKKKPPSPKNAALSTSKFSVRTRYKCRRCPYVSFCKSNIFKHKKLHLTPSKYRCNYCTYSACRWTLLKQHIKFHEGAAEEMTANTGKLEKFNDVYLDGDEDNHLPVEGSESIEKKKPQQKEEGSESIEKGKQEEGSQSIKKKKLQEASPGIEKGEPHKEEVDKEIIHEKMDVNEKDGNEGKLEGKKEKKKVETVTSEDKEKDEDEEKDEDKEKLMDDEKPKEDKAKAESKEELEETENIEDPKRTKVTELVKPEDKKDMKVAIDSFSSAKKKKTHVCSTCPFTTASTYEYEKHIKLHNADLKFRCDCCNYSLARQELMYQHHKLHASETGFIANPPTHQFLNKSWTGFAYHGEQSEVMKGKKKDGPRVDTPEHIAAQMMIKKDVFDEERVKRERDSGDMDDGDASVDEAVAYSELKDDDSQANTDVMRFGCKQCPYKCNSPKHYRMHVEMHGACKKYMCDFCNWSTERLNLMYQHRKVHAAEHGFDSECESERLLYQVVNRADLANRDSPELPKMKSEVKTKGIEGKKPKLYNCEMCPFSCDKRRSYTNHVQLHDGSKMYTCEQCTYSVDRMNLLYQHSKLHSTTDSTDTAKTSPNATKKASPKKQRLRCPKCPYHTHSHILLDLHTKMHAAGKKYTCQFCDYSIERLNMLQEHMKIHIELSTKTAVLKIEEPPQPVTSPALKKGSPAPDRATSPEKKGFYYKCDKCPYQTNNRGNFENHKNQHLTKSKLACPYCDYSSPRSAQLASHIRIHFPGSKLDAQTIRALIAGANQEQYVDPSTPLSEDTEIDGDRSRESTPGVSAESAKINSDRVHKKRRNSVVCKYCDREFGDVGSKDQHERQHLIGIDTVC